ncbi:Lrp/AsnC family transcriptional regulator [Litoribrevibacter albus]|uniref:siroheme decarboxylase n=1 Tax=Litoribrevibacter albus TaxID=1473156 RepID=A0AA37W803_9GAMM|nr:AsnC family transcriptional regulator [Litoribrevibacter albus]GLQ30896.1 protein NirG [Litoribrevibacter albus]
MDNIDKQLVNRLQDGFPVTPRPFLTVAEELGLEESEVMERVQTLLDDGILSRFGPMFQAERLGGGLTLAAMKVAPEDYEKVTEQVNAFPEVAHNYQREHELNMWFVLATETPEGIQDTIDRMEEVTGYKVYNMPKQEEFYVGLRFEL